MGFSFKNFGHAIAKVAKNFVHYTGVVAADAAKAAPIAQPLISVLAGKQAADISDLAFRALGAVAESLEKSGGAVQVAADGNGANVVLDLETVNQIKATADLIKQIIKTQGDVIPAVK